MGMFKVAKADQTQNAAEIWQGRLPFYLYRLKDMAEKCDTDAVIVLNALHRAGLVDEVGRDFIYEIQQTVCQTDMQQLVLHMLVQDVAADWSGKAKASEKLEVEIEKLLNKCDTSGIRAVGFLGDEGRQYASKLKEMAHHEGAGVRESIAWVAGKLGKASPFMLEDVKAMLQDMTSGVRSAAIWALSEMAPHIFSAADLPWFNG